MTLLVLVGVIAATGLMYATAQKELAPEEDQGILFNLVKTPPATNLDYLEQVTDHLNKVFKTVPEKEHVFAINGMGGDVHQAFTGILFKPWEERNRTQEQILQELQPKVASIAGGADPHLRQALAARLDRRPAACSSSSRRPPTTSSWRRCWRRCSRRRTKSGLFIFTDSDLKFDTPQIEVKIDHDKANSLGITMQDIGASLATLLGGNYVNRFNLYGRSYQVIPQVPRDFRLSPDWIKRYEVKTTSGNIVPLSTVVDVRDSVQPNALTSFQQLNSAMLQGVPFPGRTIGEVIDFLKAKSEEILPEGFTYDFQGESRQYEQEGSRLVVTFMFALIIIYLVLAAQYESFRDPLIILGRAADVDFRRAAAANLGLATINIYTQIGLVTLIGLISKHGILMVDYANHLQATKGSGRREAIEEAAAIRLRPILMTTAAMVIAMVPLIIATGAGAASPLRHRHRHRLRHDDRHPVHAVRDAGGLHLPRPRASAATRQRKRTRHRIWHPGRRSDQLQLADEQIEDHLDVERDDDDGDDHSQRRHPARRHQLAHLALVGGKHDERHDSERQLHAQDHLAHDEQGAGAALAIEHDADASRNDREAAGRQAPGPRRQPHVDEALHDDLAGKRRRHGRVQAAAEQRDTEERRGACGAEQRRQQVLRFFQIGDTCVSRFVKSSGSENQNRGVDEQRQHQRDS